jgi:hypothetical protein
MDKSLSRWRMSLLALGVLACVSSARAQHAPAPAPARVDAEAATLTARIAVLERERSQLTLGEPLSLTIFGSVGALTTLGYGWFTMLAPGHGEHFQRNLLIATSAFAAIAAGGAGWLIQRQSARRHLDGRLRALRVERVRLAPAVGPSGGILSVSAVFDGP